MPEPANRTFDAALGVLALAAFVASVGVLWTAWPSRASEFSEVADGVVELDGAGLQGSRTAPMAMIEFSDFSCPFCRSFANTTRPVLVERYVLTGRLLMAYRHLPIDSLHPYSRRAAEAAVCAGEQGRFVEYHSALFTKPPDELGDHAGPLANRLGLSAGVFETCIRAVGPARVRADEQIAQELGIIRTPVFIIGRLRPDGRLAHVRRLIGARPLAEFEAALREVAERF